MLQKNQTRYGISTAVLHASTVLVVRADNSLDSTIRKACKGQSVEFCTPAEFQKKAIMEHTLLTKRIILLGFEEYYVILRQVYDQIRSGRSFIQ
ncbi:MAG: hypothetical protein ABIA93_04200 [Candidatus Woesearchaeota archaeon]